MANLFEDTVADFDLNYLQPSSNNVNIARFDKQRQSILNVKKKIVASHALLKKFYMQKEKLEETESLLLASKEECRQACLDNKITQEKCIQLEKDSIRLNDINKQLEKNITHLDNQFEAMKSHAHQLQLLAKEHETVIAALKLEKQLERSTAKEYEKKFETLERKHEEYLKDILWMRDVILGKKKRMQILDILNKYRDEKITEDVDESCDNDDERDFHDSPISSPISGIFIDLANKKVESLTNKLNNEANYESDTNKLKDEIFTNDQDSDCGNELVSEDTGRGSSLALSDKFLNSPDTDFFVKDLSIVKEPVLQVDVGTSPIRVDEALISINIFGDEVIDCENNTDKTESKSPEFLPSESPINTDVVSTEHQLQLVDACTSPFPRFTDMIHESTSPINFDESVEQSVEILDDMKLDVPENGALTNSKTNRNDNVTSLNKSLSSRELDISTKTPEQICLEVNNSHKLCNEINNDEIEMILSRMQLRHELISPLPSPNEKLRQAVLYEKELNTDQHNSCPDILKIREENKALQENVSFLCKEIMLIKSLLSNKVLNNENICTSNIQTDLLINKSSQNTLITGNEGCNREGIGNITENDLICLEPAKQNEPEKEKDNISLGTVQNSEHDIEETYDCDISEMRNQDSYNETDGLVTVINKNASNCPEISMSDSLNFRKIDALSNKISAKSNSRKLTKLDRFKRKVLPKSKIRGQPQSPTRKLRMRLVPISKKDIRSNPMDILKNRDAYDKALKVMIELKSKKKCDNKFFRKRLIKRSDSRSDVRNTVTNRELKDTQNRLYQNPVIQKEDITNVSKVEKLSKRSINPLNKTVAVAKVGTLEITPIEQSSECSSLTTEIEILSSNTNKNNLSDPEDTHLKLNNNNNNDLAHDKSSQNNHTETAMPNRCNLPIDTFKPVVDKDKFSVAERGNINKDKLKGTRRRKRLDSESSNVSCKRLLRSSNLDENISKQKPGEEYKERTHGIDYSDLNIFNTDTAVLIEKENIGTETIKSKICKDKTLSREVSKEENIRCDNDSSLSPRQIRREKRSRRLLSNTSGISEKRLLRSSNLHSVSYKDTQELKTMENKEQVIIRGSERKTDQNDCNNTNGATNERLKESNLSGSNDKCNLSNSILCRMITKYGKTVVKTSAKKVPDKTRNLVYDKIEKSVSDISELPPDKTQSALKELVEDIRKMDKKHFLAGLMKYLQDPARKLELYNKQSAQVEMTKKEQIILYVIKQLNTPDLDIVKDLLRNIEFALFWLNKTPDFDVIESLSHLYAVTCRVFNLKSRLKVFMLDAMYCLHFKAIVVIKQCLTTWTHVLPLAHMAHAKSPLMTCIFYLLQFYKCDEDKMNRVRDIRNMLSKKYLYNINDMNQAKILEMFRNAIQTVKDDLAERNMLRMAIIIFAKRQGAKWCQKYIVNNLLLPIIESDKTSERVKIFCIKMLGPLFKPYSGDMKVHCEIMVNRLLDMLDLETLSYGMQEAVFTSLISMTKHNPMRVISALLQWRPDRISQEFEALLKAYVQEKPITAWKHILSKTY